MELDNIEIQIEEDTLNQFAGICEESGISVNKAVVEFVKYCINNWNLPFELSECDEAQEVI